MDLLVSPEAWAALLTLTALEIVLGIDNIVFVAIVTAKVPTAQRSTARRGGIALALVTRLALLFSITWLMGLTAPLIAPFGHAITGRDLILLVGGLFLVGKATWEIHDKLEAEPQIPTVHAMAKSTLGWVVVEIAVLDIVFSLDSVITAVGMANDLRIMTTAVVIAVGIMLWASGPIANFVERHPTIKMLALSFLLLIGVTLMAEGGGIHVSKGYIYSAMAFSLFVELLNLRFRRPAPPVHLHHPPETTG